MSNYLIGQEISVEKISLVRHIVTHANCADGTASAMILGMALPNAQIQFVQYGSDAREKMEARPRMLFCDMSPPSSRIDEFLDVGAIVLDHHIKAKENIARFVHAGLGAFADEDLNPGVGGALLAFRFVWFPLSEAGVFEHRCTHGALVEDLAVLAGIRDTWQTKHPRWIESQDLAAALKFWGPDVLVGSCPSTWAHMLGSVGHKHYQAQLQLAKSSLEGAFIVESFNGIRAAIFQTTEPCSNAAEMLRTNPELVSCPVSFIAGFSMYSEDAQLKIVYSLRSLDGFDVGAFCKVNGGGGHTAAAGFSVPIGIDSLNPIQLLKVLLDDYVRSYDGEIRP
jgi:hypothetical protein